MSRPSCETQGAERRGCLGAAAPAQRGPRIQEISVTRPTRDIDLLGRVANDVDRLITIVKEICRQEVEPDGLVFDADSVVGERIAEAAEYPGVRVRFHGQLGVARIAMQIDVGFGDAVVPSPVTVDYPVMLDLPAPRMRTYTKESVIAEKLHTMVRRGLLNSRMRDYFDIWVLSRQFDFDGSVLAEAIRATFSRRDQAMDPLPVALTGAFAADASKVTQWRGFLRTNRLQGVPGDMADVVAELAVFLGPVVQALHDGREFRSRWTAPGPWTIA